MPLKKQMVVVEGWGYTPSETDPHPEHPIYIPVDPPPDSGLSPTHPIYLPVYPDIGFPADQPHPDQGLPGDQPHPEHPIYIPVDPPPDSGLSPEHPIYVPVYPDQGLPEVPPLTELPPDATEALKAFLLGNLPPFNPPDYVQPVKR